MEMILFREETERLVQVRWRVKVLTIGISNCLFFVGNQCSLKRGILKPVYEQNKCVCM